MLFEIADGDTMVSCAISQAAIEEISDSHQRSGAALVQCFLGARTRIEAVARAKLLRTSAEPHCGTLNVWAGDFDDQPNLD